MRREKHRGSEAPGGAGGEGADAEPAQPLPGVLVALGVVAVAEVEQAVQHDHQGEQAAPEEHQLEQTPFVQLHRGDDADDGGRHHAERQLAVELIDAVGAYQAWIGAVADIGADRGCCAALRALNSVG